MKPTIGTILHYYAPAQPISRTAQLSGQGQGPFCAIVTCVREDGLLNVAILDQAGKPLPDPPCGIPLYELGGATVTDKRNGWLEWPPRE